MEEVREQGRLSTLALRSGAIIRNDAADNFRNGHNQIKRDEYTESLESSESSGIAAEASEVPELPAIVGGQHGRGQNSQLRRRTHIDSKNIAVRQPGGSRPSSGRSQMSDISGQSQSATERSDYSRSRTPSAYSQHSRQSDNSGRSVPPQPTGYPEGILTGRSHLTDGSGPLTVRSGQTGAGTHKSHITHESQETTETDWTKNSRYLQRKLQKAMAAEPVQELTEEDKLLAMLGHKTTVSGARAPYLYREDFCGACGLQHAYPGLMDMFPFCANCVWSSLSFKFFCRSL